MASSAGTGESDRVPSADNEICLKQHQLWCYKDSSPQAICLLRFVSCEERCDDQPTAPPLAGTLPNSCDGTRPEEANGDRCRTEPDASTPAQESTLSSGEQRAEADEWMIVFRSAHLFRRIPSPTIKRISPSAHGGIGTDDHSTNALFWKNANSVSQSLRMLGSLHPSEERLG